MPWDDRIPPYEGPRRAKSPQTNRTADETRRESQRTGSKSGPKGDEDPRFTRAAKNRTEAEEEGRKGVGAGPAVLKKKTTDMGPPSKRPTEERGPGE